jgi:drug/metabolite transporter (DMT)-like permease
MDTKTFGIYGLLTAFVLSINDVISFGIAKSTHLKILPTSYLIIPIILYALQLPLFYYGLSFNSMAVLNISWNLISNIFVTLIGLFYFREKIDRIETIGLIFGFFSIACFTYDDIVKLMK